MSDQDDEIATVKRFLEARGFTVLRTKSYNAMKERHYGRECELRSQVEHNEHTRAWANRAFDEQRRLSDRCTFLYGEAMARGATAADLVGDGDTP